MKYINGIVIKEGDNNPDLGCEEKYLPVVAIHKFIKLFHISLLIILLEFL